LFLFSLDYDVNVVANPDQTANFVGSCTSATAIDNIAVTSGSGANPPVICGFNSGQHGKTFSKTHK
jgi:hypothetical protein